jgi:hypothetical protein
MLNINPKFRARVEREQKSRRAQRADDLWDIVLIATAVAISWLIFEGVTNRAHASEWEIDALMEYSHTSDILRGCPFSCGTGGLEGTQDFLGAGFTMITPRRRWELDLVHGWKCIDCTINNLSKEVETGTTLAVRFYPGRR